MNRLITIVTLILSTLLSAASFAEDIPESPEPSVISEQTTSTTASEIQARSINSVSLENYLLTSTGSIGLKSTLPGPLSIATIRQLATPLYEEPGYGLYAYQHFKAHVWYQGNFASVILLMQYPNAGR